MRNKRPRFPSLPMDVIDDNQDIPTPQSESVSKTGIVDNCFTLNIRAEPEADSEILCVIPCLTEVLVEINESTDDFYKICTVSGIEGFCIKKYIAVHP